MTRKIPFYFGFYFGFDIIFFFFFKSNLFFCKKKKKVKKKDNNTVKVLKNKRYFFTSSYNKVNLYDKGLDINTPKYNYLNFDYIIPSKSAYSKYKSLLL